MEGVAFGLKECFDLCEELSYKPAKLIASGGGSKSSLWIQILADVFDREIYTTNVEEHACVGAAIVAGVGTGVYATIRDGCLAVVKMSASPAIPIRENVLKYYKTINLFKQIYAANASLFVENIKR
jgi:xylulokinase